MDSVPSPVPDSLEEATLRFGEFLRAQGWPDKVQWLAPKRALFRKKGHYWINSRKVDEGVTFARETYQQGIKRGLGISIEALCKTKTLTLRLRANRSRGR